MRLNRRNLTGRAAGNGLGAMADGYDDERSYELVRALHRNGAGKHFPGKPPSQQPPSR